MSRELEGKVALVTGVTRRAGIGAAIARELGRAGARLFVTCFRRYDEQQAWGVETLLRRELSALAEVDGLEVDLSHPGAAAELFRQARQRFGQVDILVNNAAHWEAGGIDVVSPDQLDRHYAVNVRATVMLCAEFVRQSPLLHAGRIINLTSGQGQSPMPGEIAYAVTKAALDALTISLGPELVERGIAVHAIDPGPTDTGWISKALRSEIAQASPSGRISSPDEIARLVRRLVGADAASTTGRVIRAQASE
jgi:3-oxoacyl-[acyl-carrier protein] reductase